MGGRGSELDETTASQRRVGKIRGSLTGRRESSSLFARRLNEAGQGEDRESACARDFSNCRAHYVRGMQNWGCSFDYAILYSICRGHTCIPHGDP
jgi:hypothetical protein